MYARILLFVACLALSLPRAASQQPAPPLRGFIATHDPSTMIKCKDRYYVYSTGQGILSKSSADKIFWSNGPPVFTNAPSWTTSAVPGFAGIFWAPDVLFFNNLYHLYYAVSTFGSQVSAIGLTTSPTLDPNDLSYHWTDHGPVIQSTNGSPYNTIDPSFTWDADGNLWMAFGSYWSGIYIVQLDPTTGLRISPTSPATQLAYNSSIEASYIFRRGGYYYLFVNWGSCCSGVNSTYNIRVGRSANVTGPYLDRKGINMVNGGGSLFLQGTGKFTGPGHVGILSEGGTQWFGYHYYDANDWAPQYNAYGQSDLGFVPLSWTPDDWPVVTNDWFASYRFEADALDDQRQYYGLVKNGALIQNDPIHGHVLNLDGVSQYIWLPPGAGYGQTFEAVVKWRGGGAWQRIFDFGFDTSKTVMLTAASGNNVLRCDISPGGNLQTVQWTQALPTNVWTHVAVTFDGVQGVLYVNGSPVATNTSMDLLPVNVAPQTNHLGRSKFSADPYFNGQFASFRVHGRALSAAEIAAPRSEILLPTLGSTWQPGAAIDFFGRATDFAAVPLSASNLSWQILYAKDGVTNLVFGPVSGISAGSFTVPSDVAAVGNYIVVLISADASNRQSSTSVTLAPANGTPAWEAYYPLRINTADANGHFNGVPFGGANFVSDPDRGQVLNLSGANQYIKLPAGAGTMQTFMAWVKWNGGAAWQRIFDFGNDTNHYTVLTPAAANGKLRYNISLNSIPGEQIADAASPLPVGIWTHVAVVMNGSSVLLYTNGVQAASDAFDNLIPANLNATNCYLGRSQWPADPYFNGRLSSVRIFQRALASNEIVAPRIRIDQPVPGGVFQPGTTINFSGSANDYYDAAIDPTGLVWTVNFINNGTTTAVFGPAGGITNGTFSIPASGPGATNGFYQVNLAATDGLSQGATSSVSIYPTGGATVTNWSSFFAFDTGAQDASNHFNGVLLGGASIETDQSRGNVLNLSGANQYVSFAAGTGSAQTFSGWVKWRGGNAWQRIFDFGQGVNDFFFLTPKDSSGLIQCAMTTDLSSYNRVIESTAPFPLNQWTHIAVVMDGKQGILYVNGAAVAVNNSVNLLPGDVAAFRSYFGRSQFSADPYFNGQLDSVALNSLPVSATDVMGSFLQPNLTEAIGGNQTTLSWPNWAAAMQLYSIPDLSLPHTWTRITNVPTSSSGLLTVTLPATNTSAYYRLQWP
jgi:arabinan endo-1,5-alpha-L-arabinosidase